MEKKKNIIIDNEEVKYLIKTELTEMLGIEHPIIQGGMGPFDTTRLAIGVSNAGALGMISTTWFFHLPSI